MTGGTARIRRLVAGVAIAVFVVPVAAIVVIEATTRAAHDDMRERVVGAATALAAAATPGQLPAIARRFEVDAWIVDPRARAIVATTEAHPRDRTDLGYPGGLSSIAMGSGAAVARAFERGRVAVWQREAVVRADEHGASESCAIVEPDALDGGLVGDASETLWSCAAARRRADGTIALAEGTAPRVASRLVDVRRPLLVLAGLVVLVGAIALAWLVRRLARPLDELHARVRALTAIPRPPEPPPPVGRAPREIAEVARAVETLVARLDDARAQQAVAAADLVHDLKGPLARIKLALEAVPTTPAIDGARAAVLAIDRTVGDLLEIAHAEAGLVAEPRTLVDLTALVTDILDAWRPGEATLRATAARELRAPLAASAVGRALVHLLENALAFRAAGPIVVELGESADGRASIAVCDDGRGVDAAFAPSLFRRFASRRPGGSGLGLAYVRAVAEAHGGRATYARADGETRFTIVLAPRAPVHT